MKRDAPKGVPPYATPAKQRDSRSLRAQLTRAVGEAIRAVGLNGTKTALPSRQRLADVLWNDRTLLATSRAADETREADEVTNPRLSVSSLPGAVQSVRAEPSVEIASDREVAAWLLEDAPEPEPVADAEAAEAFAAAVESVVAERGRRRTPTPPQIDDVAVAAERVRRRTPTPPQLTPKPPAPAPAGVRAEPLPPPPAAAKLEQPVAPPPAAKIEPAPPRSPAVVAPVVRKPAPEPEGDDEDETEEPICTRSMARLLAGQGHRARALKIYDTLLKTNASDASLRAEADALRQEASA